MYRTLIRKLKYCVNPTSLLEFEDRFNDIGLTIQTNPSGRLFLCRIIDGRPACQTVFEDHIPICDQTDVFDDDVQRRIFEFIIEHAAKSEKLNEQNVGNFGLYGSSMHDKIRSDDVGREIIAAIGEWLK